MSTRPREFPFFSSPGMNECVTRDSSFSFFFLLKDNISFLLVIRRLDEADWRLIGLFRSPEVASF